VVANVSLLCCNLRPFPKYVDRQANTLIPAEHTRTTIEDEGLVERIKERKEG
jgi:hypothetical protein